MFGKLKGIEGIYSGLEIVVGFFVVPLSINEMENVFVINETF